MSRKERLFQPIGKPAPEFSLSDAGGRPVAAADFRGKVVVLHFIHASCRDACPPHADKIAEVQMLVNASPMRDSVRFLSITTDPVKDSPEVMRAYGRLHGLDPANWTFLTRSPGQPENATRRLAQAFGHTFSQAGDGSRPDGVVTHIVDKQGRWRANFHDLGFTSVNVVLYVNALVNDARHSPAEQKGLWSRLRELF